MGSESDYTGEPAIQWRGFLSTYNIPVAPNKFAEVFDALPPGTTMLFRNTGRLVDFFEI